MRNLVFIVIILGLLFSCNFSFAQNMTAEFDSISARELVNNLPKDSGDELYESLRDAVGNWKNLGDAFAVLPPELHEDAIWLINNMTHLDRLLINTETLVEHIVIADSIKNNVPYAVPDSMYRQYILAYRVSYEPVTPWRRLVINRFKPVVGKNTQITQIVESVNKWVADSLEEGDYNFFGGMQSPDMTLKRKKGNSGEISAFLSSVLKAFGIPSRNVYIQAQGEKSGGKSWVEYFDGESWLPIYTENPEQLGNKNFIEEGSPENVTYVFSRSGFEIEDVTDGYTQTGIVKAQFTINGKPMPEFNSFSIQVKNSGALVAQDYVNTQADTFGVFKAELGNGQYVLTSGQRDSKGNPYVTLTEFEIKVDDTTKLNIDVTPPMRIEKPEIAGTWGNVELPMANGKLQSVAFKENIPTVVFIYDYRGEPSVRMIELLNNAFDEMKDSVKITAISIDEFPGGSNANEAPKCKTLYDIECGLKDIFDVDCESFKVNLPKVLYFEKAEINKDHKYDIISDGLNLNIIENIKSRYRESEK